MAKADRTGRNEQTEHWTKMLRATMQTEAWRALSPTAQALYPWFKFEWRGPNANNNGKISLSVRQAAECVGCNKNTAGKAIHDLQAKGFLFITGHARLGFDGEAKSPTFEVTEIAPVGQHEGRKLYRDWRPGKDFPVTKAPVQNPAGRAGKAVSRIKNADGTVLKFHTKAQRPYEK